jgi:hypothetical protein
MFKFLLYFDSLTDTSQWVFTLGLALSSFVDFLITTSLCYFLRSSRTESSRLVPAVFYLAASIC